MLSKIAQTGIQITFEDLLSGYKGIFFRQEETSIEVLSNYLPSRYVFLVNSGTAAFYIILQALKELSKKKEVILPAYTAPSIVLPILKAKLKPVLCDISLSDFNMDLDLLPKVVTENTLCIVPTHLFGIAVSGIEGLKERMPDVFMVEDCAQSMGSRIEENNLGSFSDVGFLSFNRGKNLPTYGGGCIFTDSQELAEKIEIEVDKLAEQSTSFKLMLPFKMLALSLAVRPFIYGFFYPLISQFKDSRVPEEFSLGKYTDFQAGIGLSLLRRIDEFSEKRYQNGMTLINGLADIEEIILPDICKDARHAFNRLPVVFKNWDAMKKVKRALWKAGIDTSLMYLKPIHHIFDLGYKDKDFPNANYFANRMLTLPVHPLVRQEDLNKMINVFRKRLKWSP